MGRVRTALTVAGYAVGMGTIAILLASYLRSYFFSSVPFEFIVYDNAVGEFWPEVVMLSVGLVGLTMSLRTWLKAYPEK